jgi:hypothetical protein
MGATSVTGAGAGAAEPNRGPGNNRNQYVSLLDPHVVLTGKNFTDGGNMAIVLPPDLVLPPEQLSIMVSGKAWAANKNTNGDGNIVSFTVYAPKKVAIDWVVIKDPSANFGTDVGL